MSEDSHFEDLGITVIPPELLEKASPEEREAYLKYLVQEVKRVDDWQAWLRLLFPDKANKPFSEAHMEFWEWVWRIENGKKPPALVVVLSRGHGKSTTAELAVVALAARGIKKYVLYVSGTQDQADDHVGNIAGLLESPMIDIAYEKLGTPKLNKEGNAKGWRRNRIWTEAGFVVDAMGLDSAARGANLQGQRPDLILLDDIDVESDTEDGTDKKIRTITRKLLPAGAPDCAVLMIQNLVHNKSIFAQLVDNTADFLYEKNVIGPIPAVLDLEVEQVDGKFQIVGGTPTWPEGFGLDKCQEQINEFGYTSFLAECQHETRPPDGGIFDHIDFSQIRVDHKNIPQMTRTVVWVDPAVTSTETSDSMGIQCDGLGTDKKIYRLFSWEQKSSPYKAIHKAVEIALLYNADVVGIETNNGRDTWKVVYEQVISDYRKELAEKGEDFFTKMPRYKEVVASKEMGSKIVRAEKMLVDYERGTFRHVEGTTHVLEQAEMRFPKVKPYDLVDAAAHSWAELAGPLHRRKHKIKSVGRKSVPYGSMSNAPGGRR